MATHYIDHSAANNGDGTDAAQAASGGAVGAFNGLVANLGSIAAGDTVWIRRSGTAEALSAVFTLWDGGGCYGWPKSTDPTYATRPASGTSAGWDADADDYAEFTTASTTNILVRPTTATAVMTVRRIHMLTSSTSSSMRGVHLAISSENTLARRTPTSPTASLRVPQAGLGGSSTSSSRATTTSTTAYSCGLVRQLPEPAGTDSS